MLRNIFPKIFLSFFLCTFLFLSFPENLSAQEINPTNVICKPTEDPKVSSCTYLDCSMTGPGLDIPCKQETYLKNEEEVAKIAKDNPNALVVTGKEKSNSCFSWTGGIDVSACITSVFDFVFSWILKTINWFLKQIIWLSSLIFDFTVYFTIVKFKTNFADLKFAGLGTVAFGANGSGLIYYIWGMIRDFLNILIFLSIIYSAVQSMFEGFVGTRKKFTALLVFSIVANFSLLFVKLAIDVSNILCLQAYTLAVKPTSTETFWQFRNVGGTGVTSYGEYIMNSVDLNKLTDEAKGSEAAKAQISQTQDTFIFQLGRMIVYIGIIYILLFMAGLLLTRAVILLLAMIVSPLIAADIFFKMIDPKDELQAIAVGVRGLTNKIKGDFYDSLVKGPLLIFFVFLIGVFAESVLGQGVLDTLNNNLDKMKDVKNVSSPFTTSLFVFFKFVLFIYLCNMFFGILNDIKLGGTSGTALRKYGGQFANKILGRGIGGAAFLGRNIVGRGVNNSGISNTLARWNANATAKLADEKTGFLGRQLNRTIQSATNRGQKGAKGLITGSYDARSRIDKLLGAKSGLGKTLSAATGLKSGDFGDGGKGGFADRDKAKLAAKKEAEDARTKITADNLKADEKKVAETDAKFEGVTMSLGKMADVLKEVSSKSEAEQKSLKDTLDKEIKEGRTVTIAGQVFTKSSEISKIFDKSQPDSLDAVYTKEKEAAESRLEKEAKKKFEKHREAQKALGNTETLGETLNILDKLTSNTPGAFAEAAWLQQRKTLGEEAKKKAKGKVTKTEQVLSIEGELKPQANSLIKEIDQILEDSSDMQKVILNDSLKALREMEAFVPESDDKEVGKNLGKFNKDIFNKAQEAKERALKVLSQYYYNTPPANMNKADVNKKITEIAALRRKIEQSKKDYRSTLTDEEKKAAGVASKGGKKEGDGSTKDDKAATDNPKKDKPEK